MKKISISRRHGLHIVLSFLTLLFCIYFFATLNQQPQPKGTFLVDRVFSLYTNTDIIPSKQNQWQQTALPDDWFRTSLGQYKWYRFEVPSLQFKDSLLAIYLTYSSRPVSIFINNQQLLVSDISHNETARTWGQPQIIKLNLNSFSHQQNKNYIDIKLPSNQSGSGMLGNIYIGPEITLMKAFKQAFFIKVTLVELLVFAMILSSFFVFLLWVFRQDETIYAFYAIAVFLWAIYSYSHIPDQLLVSSQIWEWLRSSAMVFWSVSISLFCNRFLNSVQPKIEKILVLHSLAIAIGLLFIEEDMLYWLGDYFFPAYATLLGLYPSYRMLNATFKQGNDYLSWLTMCGMMVMLLASHDIVVMAHWMSPWQGLYLHYSALILLTVFNLILIKRFVDTLNEVESLNKNQERIIEHKTTELKANYEKFHLLQLEKDLNSERERIMHDMHDGIGGSLVSMRSALERVHWQEDDIFDGLGNALDDLYLMIHSLDPFDNDLTIALGSIRHTLEKRLRRSDINMQWVIDTIPKMNDLSPTVVLAVMRIMQEAIANVIKHSGAKNVIIEIPFKTDFLPPSSIAISISDDGCGILETEINKNNATYGVSGMMSRALKVGAEVFIRPTSPGTQVLIQLPFTKIV